MAYFRVGLLITVTPFVVGVLILFANARLGHSSDALSVSTEAGQMLVSVSPQHGTGSQRIFRVVLLRETPEERAMGLQGFRPLARDEAALFVFRMPESVVFWMGSVDYPIDIVFIGSDNRVIRVYSSSQPGSKDLYPSGGPVKWVLETAAGSGIRYGDVVEIRGLKK